MKKELIMVKVAHSELLEWNEPRVLNVAGLAPKKVFLFGKRIRDFPRGGVDVRYSHTGLILSDALKWIMGISAVKYSINSK